MTATIWAVIIAGLGIAGAIIASYLRGKATARDEAEWRERTAYPNTRKAIDDETAVPAPDASTARERLRKRGKP